MKRTSPSERLLAEARRAIERKQFDDARGMLEAAIKYDGSDPRPWLMLAGIAPSPRERRAFLAQAGRLQAASPSAGTPSAYAPAAAPTLAAGTPPARRWPALLALLALLVAGVAVVWFLARGALPGALAGPDNARPTYGSTASTDVGLVIPTVNTGGGASPASTGSGATPLATEAGTSAQSTREVATAPVATAPVATVPVKQVVAGEDPLATWTVTAQPTPTLAPTLTPTPTPEPTATPEPPPPGSPRPPGVGAAERWINVNLTTQTLVAYEGDNPVFTTLVSSGLFQWPTVTGQYRTYMKYESQTMNGYLLGYDYYLTDVPYVMYFFEDYAIHGAYWHNNFGTPMSHGCVNVSPTDAGWLFNWAPVGTLVNIHY
jgi:lipoprotein-anchoring transpeptidase ErfK/SrfK